MERSVQTRSDALRYFHPGWFAAVMGTGILAVATKHSADVVPGLEDVAVLLWVLNGVLCAVLLVPWIARWVRFPDEAWADTAHPTRGPFFSTLPIALLVLGVDFVSIGRDVAGVAWAETVARGLWIVGAVLAFVFGIVIPYRWFTVPSMPTEQINGGWFMPPVANIVVPAASAPLLDTWGEGSLRLAMCILSFAFLGIGLLLFLVVGVLLIGRLVSHAMPEGHLVPTLWIGLGPIGVGSLALVRLAGTAHPMFGEHEAAAQVLLGLGSLVLWGFGLWWLAMAIALTVRALREPFPFAMSWWAFTFPLGAYTVATYLLADTFEASVLRGFAFVLWAVLAAFWTLVVVRTVGATYAGSIFAPPPVPQPR